MKKKVLAAVIVLSLGLALLAACGGVNDADTRETQDTRGTPAPTEAPAPTETPAPPDGGETASVLEIPDYIYIRGVSFSTSLTELDLRMAGLFAGIGAPTEGEVVQFQVGGDGLTDEDILPLRYMKNLVSLNLNNNQISDLSPLAGLTNLESLQLVQNQISDISPLAGLNNLRVLTLSFNQIGDISPLTDLINLNRVDLELNPITDLSPVAHVRYVNFALAGGRDAGATPPPSANIPPDGTPPLVYHPRHGAATAADYIAGVANLRWCNEEIGILRWERTGDWEDRRQLDMYHNGDPVFGSSMWAAGPPYIDLRVRIADAGSGYFVVRFHDSANRYDGKFVESPIFNFTSPAAQFPGVPTGLETTSARVGAYPDVRYQPQVRWDEVEGAVMYEHRWYRNGVQTRQGGMVEAGLIYGGPFAMHSGSPDGEYQLRVRVVIGEGGITAFAPGPWSELSPVWRAE